jgi:hypothetical protein
MKIDDESEVSLDRINAEHQSRSQAKRLETLKNPALKAKKKKGRIQKNRGYAFERWVADQLGPHWERMAMSGALGGRWAGDVRHTPEDRHLEPGVPVVLECKRRQNMKQLHRWLEQGGAEALVLGTVGDAVVVLPLATFKCMLSCGG